MWSKRKTEMGWSEAEVGCKKHRNQNKQLEGVCPFCLRERLTQLAADSQSQLLDSFSPDSSQSASPAGCISFAPSNTTSPAHARGRHIRNVSEGIGSIAFMFGSRGLKKSRSVAFDGELNKNAKKKKGFWRKLFDRERFREAYA